MGNKETTSHGQLWCWECARNGPKMMSKLPYVLHREANLAEDVKRSHHRMASTNAASKDAWVHEGQCRAESRCVRGGARSDTVREGWRTLGRPRRETIKNDVEGAVHKVVDDLLLREQPACWGGG